MSFNVSDKVVCVDDTPALDGHRFWTPKGFVKCGAVYVVAGSVETGRGPGILIVGLPSYEVIRADGVATENGWNPSRFILLSKAKAEHARQGAAGSRGHRPHRAARSGLGDDATTSRRRWHDLLA